MLSFPLHWLFPIYSDSSRAFVSYSFPASCWFPHLRSAAKPTGTSPGPPGLRGTSLCLGQVSPEKMQGEDSFHFPSGFGPEAFFSSGGSNSSLTCVWLLAENPAEWKGMSWGGCWQPRVGRSVCVLKRGYMGRYSSRKGLQ